MSPPSRLLPPPQNNSDNDDTKNRDSYPESLENNKGGWDYIQAITNPTYIATKEGTEQNEEVYIHPLVKRSASALSSKSLEMCTEYLGCETGSSETSSFSWEREKMQLPSDDYSSLHSEKSQQLYEFSSLSINNDRSSSYRKFTKLSSPKGRFPPPLTSIGRSDGVKLRHHREGGRLIINAAAVSSSRTYFEADRTNGRLRLSFHREYSADCDRMTKGKDKEVFEDVNNTRDEEVLEHENVSELADEEAEADEDCWDDTDEIERKIRELPGPSKYKEGGRKGKWMSNWRPF